MPPYILLFVLVAAQSATIHTISHRLLGRRADDYPGGAILGATALFALDDAHTWFPILPLLMCTAIAAHLLSTKVHRMRENKTVTK